jgi:tetratricopeptide (TPR) repeat protein
MRRFLIILTTATATALAAGGCRIPGIRAPVPAALATSRQLSQQGAELLEQGHQAEAEKVLAKAVATYDKDPDARRSYAEALWLRGAQREAIKQLEEGCRLAADDAAMRVRLAEMHLATGHRDLAAQSVEQAIKLSPRQAAAWAVRARIMRAAGNVPQALADNQRALGYAPNDRQVLREMAEVYGALRQSQRALETLQSLAETYSPGEEPLQVLYHLGLAYSAVGRYDDAVEKFAAAAGKRPTPEVLYRLAEAHYLAGRGAAASAALRQALAFDPRHQASRDLLGRIELAAQPGGPIQR